MDRQKQYKQDFILRTIEKLTGFYGVPADTDYRRKLFNILSKVWDNKFWEDNMAPFDDMRGGQHSTMKQSQAIANVFANEDADADYVNDLIWSEINDPEEIGQFVQLNEATDMTKSEIQKMIKDTVAIKTEEDVKEIVRKMLKKQYKTFWEKSSLFIDKL